MFEPFPDSAKTRVSSSLAADLSNAARRLPDYDNKDYYSLELQTSVYDRIRDACPEGFDELVDSLKICIARRPYVALLQGIEFDAGNRLFVALNRAFGNLVA